MNTNEMISRLCWPDRYIVVCYTETGAVHLKLCSATGDLIANATADPFDCAVHVLFGDLASKAFTLMQGPKQ